MPVAAAGAPADPAFIAYTLLVTAIVFDYRGFDTLGEATVLFAAVLAVGVIFRRLQKGEEYEND